MKWVAIKVLSFILYYITLVILITVMSNVMDDYRDSNYTDNSLIAIYVLLNFTTPLFAISGYNVLREIDKKLDE